MWTVNAHYFEAAQPFLMITIDNTIMTSGIVAAFNETSGEIVGRTPIDTSLSPGQIIHGIYRHNLPMTGLNQCG